MAGITAGSCFQITIRHSHANTAKRFHIPTSESDDSDFEDVAEPKFLDRRQMPGYTNEPEVSQGQSLCTP